MSNRRVLITLCLAAAALAPYVQTLGFDFVRLDDGTYVTANRQVLQGFTPETLRWAFTGPHSRNWHPLTSLSHMLDVELFGTNPAGHHATSVLLHGVNSVLLFLALHAFTRRLWPSALVAALFAVHPLHVESVAWISERKDVLSLLFMLLTLRAYLSYARRGGRARYLAVAALFALALMSKPTVVTLPCVLLLLDFWPLYRTPGEVPAAAGQSACPQRSVTFLIAEKLPLLALSAASSAMTLGVQGSGNPDLTLWQRLANTLMSYTRYIGKSFWPSDLSALYPHPYLAGGQPYEAWEIALAAGFLAAITVAVLWGWRRRYPLVGWLWFLGMLVPTLGLVQVGEQAMADRYTYIPQIGLSILVIWSLADLLQARPALARRLRPLAIGLVALVLLGFTGQTWAQARHWRGSIPLFEHSLRVAPGSPLLNNNLGNALVAAGRYPEAVRHLRIAVRLKPEYASGHFNLGNALRFSRKPGAALEHFRRVLELAPDKTLAHLYLGDALAELGRFDEALAEYRVSLQTDPADAHYSIGNVIGKQGRVDEAIEHYRQSLAANPGRLLLANVHNNLGAALLNQRRFEEARTHFQQAVEARPDHPDAVWNLDMVEDALGPAPPP